MFNARETIMVIGIILTIFSCHNVNDKVSFDKSFKGARLDSVITINDSTFKLLIKPAFEPVNKSPYYAFSVESTSDRNITIDLDYGDYKHRYIPKLSIDKKNWKPIKPENISIDTITGIATLNLKLSKEKLYIAAQEIETSDATYKWVDSMIKRHPEIKKIVAGKTALKNDLYVLETEKPVNTKSIVLVARQHPPEIPGGTFSFKSFYEELLSSTELATRFRDHFNVYAFPLLNPDGADMGNWRHNANGKDLNRDWVDFSQPETQTVKTYLLEKISNTRTIEFAIDFHTSYSGPYMLVLDSINTTKSKNIIPKWINNIEINSSFKVEARKRSQELPYCYNYFYNTYDCETVTYEEGDEIDREIIKERAKVYAQQLMKTMLFKLENNAL